MLKRAPSAIETLLARGSYMHTHKKIKSVCVCLWGGRKKSWSVPNKSVRYTQLRALSERKKKSMMAYSFLFGDEGRAKKKVEEEEEKKPYWLLSGVCVSSALGLLTRPSSLKASTLLLYNPSAFFSRWFHFEFFSLPSCIFISPPCVSPASSSHSTHNPNAPAWYAVWSGGGERKLQAYPPVIIQVLFFFFSFFLSPLLLLLLFLFSLSTSILPFFSTWDEVKKKKKNR